MQESPNISGKDSQHRADTTQSERDSSQPPGSGGIIAQDSVVTIMILPCANGYDYASANYNLDELLAQNLKKLAGCKVVPVPYKKLQGKGYNGVFDKKDCAWVMKNSDADFLLLSRIEGSLIQTPESESGDWGYRTRLVDTRANTQTEFISAHKLRHFSDLEDSIAAQLPKAMIAHLKAQMN